MTEEELEQYQLELALANSLKDHVPKLVSHTGTSAQPIAKKPEESFSSQDLAFFSNADINSLSNKQSGASGSKVRRSPMSTLATSAPYTDVAVTGRGGQGVTPVSSTSSNRERNITTGRRLNAVTHQHLGSSSTPSSPVPRNRTGLANAAPAVQSATPPPQQCPQQHAFFGSDTNTITQPTQSPTRGTYASPPLTQSTSKTRNVRSGGASQQPRHQPLSQQPISTPQSSIPKMNRPAGSSHLVYQTHNNKSKASNNKALAQTVPLTSQRNQQQPPQKQQQQQQKSILGSVFSAAAAAMIGTPAGSTSSGQRNSPTAQSSSVASGRSASGVGSHSSKVCAACKKACVSGQIVSTGDGATYHAACFVCAKCGVPITGPFSQYTGAATGATSVEGGRSLPYHPTCLEAVVKESAIQQGLVCKVCRKPCVSGKYFTTSNNDFYHATCFKCTKCKRPIEGQYTLYGGAGGSSSGGGDGASLAPYHNHCAHQAIKDDAVRKGLVCTACNKPCVNCRYLTTLKNEIYHAECFRCQGCGELIDGQYSERGDPGAGYYHSHCAVELFNPRCCLCCQVINGQYLKHPFFDSEMYCYEHTGQKSCFACGRKEPLPGSKRERFTDLMDGRSLCAECVGSVIVDSAEAADIYKSVVTFMSSGLGLTIPSEMWDVPVLVVDIQSLNENINQHGGGILGNHDTAAISNGGPGNDTIGGASPAGLGTGLRAGVGANTGTIASGAQVQGVSIVRGVTLSRCRQVRHISGGALSLATLYRMMSNNSDSSAHGGSVSSGLAQQQQQQQLPTSLYRTEELRDVTAVLVLFGLPRDLIASILAHEAMHVWMKLNKRMPFKMPPKLEEGLCQVVAYLFLEHLAAHRDKEGELARTCASARSGDVHGGAGGASTPSDRRSASNGRSSEARNDSLRSYFHYQIMQDQSDVYGNGFREAYKAVAALGLEVTLDYVQQHQALPTV